VLQNCIVPVDDNLVRWRFACGKEATPVSGKPVSDITFTIDLAPFTLRKKPLL
jgi:hypothetical protein